MMSSGIGQLDPSMMKSPAQHAIRRELRRRLGRQWQVGTRLPPIKELARQLGAGQNSTHEAIRELAREGLVISRQRQGTFVVREPQYDADAPPHGAGVPDLASRTICVYHTGINPEGMIRRMMDSFAVEIEPMGPRITNRALDSNGEFQPGDPDPAADAIVVCNPASATPVRCHSHQLLTVVSTTMYRQIAMSVRYDMVSVNEHHGGTLAGQTLREHGCRDTCFIGCRLSRADWRYDATSSLRLLGFEAGWTMTLPRENLLTARSYTFASGADAFRDYLKQPSRPEGVFAASDDLAIGFVIAAISHGMKPGRDFQIVGFDGQDGGRRLGIGALTTVQVPAEEMGRRAAQLLIERFAQPDGPIHRLQLDCSLFQGATTRSDSQETSS